MITPAAPSRPSGIGVKLAQPVGPPTGLSVQGSDGGGVPVGPGVAVGVGPVGVWVGVGGGAGVVGGGAVGVVTWPQAASPSAWRPSNSADSASWVVVVPVPLKKTTWLPGGF